MNLFDLLQKQNIEMRKLVAYLALFVLAVPLLILVGWKFQKKLSNFKGGEFVESLQMPQSQTTTSDFSQQALEDLNQALLLLEQEMASSTSLSGEQASSTVNY